MNCLWWQRKTDKANPGKYYRVDRETFWNVWAWLKWRHYLLMPRICPDHKKPCPHLISYAPKGEKLKHKLPPLFFEGEVKQGDE